MNLMIEQKENYSWVTQVGLHGQTSEGLELDYKKFDLKKLDEKKIKYTKQQILDILELKCVPKMTQKRAKILLKVDKKIDISKSTISKIWNGKYFS